jgi:hypothetical protein
MIQYKENNKWHWSKDWVYQDKQALEREFLEWYNDWCGRDDMKSLSNRYRIKSIKVVLPEIVK